MSCEPGFPHDPSDCPGWPIALGLSVWGNCPLDKRENSGCGSLPYPKHPCCDHDRSAAMLTSTQQALNILNAWVLGSQAGASPSCACPISSTTYPFLFQSRLKMRQCHFSISVATGCRNITPGLSHQHCHSEGPKVPLQGQPVGQPCQDESNKPVGEAVFSEGHRESHIGPHLMMTAAIHGVLSQMWSERKMGQIVLTWIAELQPLVLPQFFLSLNL